jgi:hypothetical protein
MAELNDLKLTPASTLTPEFLQLCESVMAKRARTVIDHILKHGVITNEELSEQYGYDHPPRAIRDVRENGIPLITHNVTSPKTGRRMGAYTFDDLGNIRRGRVGGRKAFSKKFKMDLIAEYGARDAFSGEALDERYLQIDHRIPYEIAGDGEEMKIADFMLIDGSSQRSKSWSCEHCENFREIRDASICRACFWASPESYDHVAMEEKRRAEIVWAGEEVEDYERAKARADKAGVLLSALIKELLRK